MTARIVTYLRSATLPMALLTILGGCGGPGDGFSGSRGMVSGKIMFDGKPIPPESRVMFQSKEGNTYIATGVVKEDGKYDLVYNGEKRLPAVSYLVQISAPTGGPPVSAKPTVADPKDIKAITPADMKKMTNDAKNAKLPFPAKYSSFQTSNLTFDVKEGSNTADFNLEK